MLSFSTLPIEILYRIFDELRDRDLFISVLNVCERFNVLLEAYQRYQVNLKSIFRAQ